MAQKANTDTTTRQLFDERIWAAVRSIPRGRVASYGQVAAAAGRPRAARMIGRALGRSPKPLPWHRVLNAQGRIAFPAGSAPHREQKRRLLAEGVKFTGGRVDLARHGWQRRSAAPLLD